MRIVHGVPISWNPIIATAEYSHLIKESVWSPCSRFIAICQWEPKSGIRVLDAVTLNQVNFFTPPCDHNGTCLIAFSPKNHLLTWLCACSNLLISWDLQTGIVASEIPIKEDEPIGRASSITYSQCGTMFGVLFQHSTIATIATIATYNVFSSTPIYYHSIGGTVGMFWTHGKYIQYTTLGWRSFTIWEVGFISGQPATQVKSLPYPDNFHDRTECYFLPTLSRLAVAFTKNVEMLLLGCDNPEMAIFVWDAQNSKFLLNPVDVELPRNPSFSSDGYFFMCSDRDKIYIWKESPTGYILHRKLRSHGEVNKALLSPNGQLIFKQSLSTLELWHTTDSMTSSTLPTQASQLKENFILGFSPDESMVAVARLRDNVATVVNITSCSPQLIIDTGMEIFGLGVNGDTVVVVGNGKVVTWRIPTGYDCLEVRASSIQTVMLDQSPLLLPWAPSVSISPDFNHILIAGMYILGKGKYYLCAYSMSTGKCLAEVQQDGYGVWFTSDGCKVWSSHTIDRDGSPCIVGWAIVKGNGSDLLKLEPLDTTQHKPEGDPRKPPCGYGVTDDGWILTSSGKRLLWTPPHWRLYLDGGKWVGRFLGILHGTLPEAVILKLPEE
jgi:WD40 repeat protein